MTILTSLAVLLALFVAIQMDDQQKSQMNQIAIQFGCQWQGHERGFGHTYSWHLVCEEAPK